MKLNKIGNVCSIVALIIAIVQLFVQGFSFIWAVIVFILLGICIIIYFDNKTKKKYMEALKKLQVFHYNILREQNGYNEFELDKSINKLQKVCSDISDIFNVIKDNKVSVCIKYTNRSKDEDLYVKTLARDKLSLNGSDRIKYDKINKEDKIKDNTDFLELYKKIIESEADWQEVFYFANFLPQKHQYNNSHLDLDRNSLPPDEWYSGFARNRKWPLPYKSTIVVPIISDDKKNIYGYLCVDSEKNQGFKKEYDVNILQNIALIISQTIKIVSEKHLV